MKTRLQCESLELRENPAGPVVVDPITETPTTGTGSTGTDSTSGVSSAAIQQILDATLAALAGSQ